MKIVIDHEHCQHADAYADRCLSATIRNPLGHERPCMVLIEDDGKKELTVVMMIDGKPHTLVLHNEEEREIAASDGWVAFIGPESKESRRN